MAKKPATRTTKKKTATRKRPVAKSTITVEADHLDAMNLGTLRRLHSDVELAIGRKEALAKELVAEKIRVMADEAGLVLADVLKPKPGGKKKAAAKAKTAPDSAKKKIAAGATKAKATAAKPKVSAAKATKHITAKVSTKNGVRRTRGPQPAKYANPENKAETWAGFGRKPRWLESALKAGAKLESFAL